MKVNNSNLCLDCDSVFVGEECPCCLGHTYFPLRKWIVPLHSFNEIKEARDASKKSNLPLQKKPQGVLCSVTEPVTIHGFSADGNDKYIHNLQPGESYATNGDSGAESPEPKACFSYHKGRIRMESEGSFKSWSDRTHASATNILGVVGRLLKRGFEMPSKEYNSGNNYPKVLSEDKPQSESGIG